MTTPTPPEDPETENMREGAAVEPKATPQRSTGVTVRRVDPPPAVSWVCAACLVVLCFEIPTATWIIMVRLSELLSALAVHGR